MAASETLRARVDKPFARKVERWAVDHGTDVSEVIRIALRRLLAEDDVERRVQAAMRRFKDYERKGLFDPPPENVNAGGFR